MAGGTTARGACVIIEPLPAECAGVRRYLAQAGPGRELPGHLTQCRGCSHFAAALAELDGQLTRLPQPEPPPGAADRAIARFRASLGTVPPAVTVRPAPTARPPAATPQPHNTRPPRTRHPGQPLRGGPAPAPQRPGQARKRRRVRVSLAAAGLAAAVAAVLALAVAPRSAGHRTDGDYAAILHQAAARTAARKSARFGLTGAIGLPAGSLPAGGPDTTAIVSGTGASQFPDRGKLTEAVTLRGTPLAHRDIVSVGGQAWMRTGAGPWNRAPDLRGQRVPIDQALALPAQALTDFTQVGSGYRSLGMTTLSGTQVRQIQFTIPASSFHAFGTLPEQAAGRWSVVVDVATSSLVLQRISITGRGTARVLGSQVPFSSRLALTMHDFGSAVSIQQPAAGAAS